MAFITKRSLLNPRKIYSIRSRLLAFIACILVFLSLTTLYISAYFTQQLRKSTYHNTQNTLALYNAQLSMNLENFEIFLYDINQYTSDLSSINTHSPRTVGYYQHILNLKRLLDYTRPSFKEIDAIFLYAPLSDTYIQSQKDSRHSDITGYLKETLRSLNQARQLDTLNTASWFTHTIEDHTYMIRIVNTNGSFIGSWSELSSLTASFDAISGLNGQVLYLQEDGRPIEKTSWEDTVFDVKQSLDHYKICKNKAGESYLLSSAALDYCDYYLAMLIPLSAIDSNMQPVYSIIMLIAVLLIVFAVFITTTISHFVSAPLRSIEQTALAVHNGNYSSQFLAESTNCLELNQINVSFNKLLTEIEALKLHVYEEKMAKTEFELRSLKTQIAPHFLINCMQGIFSLVERKTENYELIQKMVHVLSNHLRYALSSHSSVSWKEELAYVDNYIELNKMRFPGCLIYKKDIREDVEEITIFPMLVLTLTENSIKHNLIMGESLTISISAFLQKTEDGHFLHIIHIDSGSGFSQDLLESLSSINSAGTIQKNGHHIGLLNICSLFRLIYPKNARISFSNEPDMGARIDIDIPISSDGTDLASLR